MDIFDGVIVDDMGVIIFRFEVRAATNAKANDKAREILAGYRIIRAQQFDDSAYYYDLES